MSPVTINDRAIGIYNSKYSILYTQDVLGRNNKGIIGAGNLVTNSDPHWDKVVLAMHMDGSNDGTTFVDETGRHTFTAAVGTPVTKTGVKKFGTASYYTNGTAALGISNNLQDLPTGTASFTVEMWIYPTTNMNNHYFLSAGAYGFALLFYDFKIRVGQSGSTALIDSTTTPALNTWHHVAVCQDANGLRLYLNGVLEGTYGTAPYGWTTPTSDAKFGYHGTIAMYTGYIDDVRITKGVARYTSNFTPPTEPFPNQ